MAQLAAVKVGDRIPAGRYFEQTFLVALTGTNPADEWIVTGFDEVVSVVGYAVIGTAGLADAPAFMLNLLGTGGAASAGALGIESITAQLIQVTVRGKGA